MLYKNKHGHEIRIRGFTLNHECKDGSKVRLQPVLIEMRGKRKDMQIRYCTGEGKDFEGIIYRFKYEEER